MTSWKEIAVYLDRGVRTCQRWEKKLHLPVYRMDNSIRAKVFAYKDEIDEWLRNRIRNNEITKKSFFERKGALAGTVLGSSGAVVALVFLLLFFPLKKERNLRQSSPDHFSAEGNTVYFYDENDSYLWDVRVEPNFNVEKYYTLPTDNNGQRRVDFADIDGDKKNEVLVFFHTEDPENRSLILFDSDGSLIWEKKLRLRQKYRDETLKDKPFFGLDLRFGDISGDREPEILVLWRHFQRFPGVFAVYDQNGKELFRYTHTGHLSRFWLFEDEREQKFIYLAGTNNLLNGDAVLAVLDCSDLKSGTGPPYDIPGDLAISRKSVEKYIPINPAIARQKYYLRIKHNELSQNCYIRWLHPQFVFIKARRIEFSVFYAPHNAKLYYRFDPGFQLLSVVPNIDFEKAWNKYYREGKFSISLEKLISRADESTLFWDGSDWQVHPVQVKK